MYDKYYMHLFKSKFIFWILIIVSVIAYLYSMVIVKIDTSFDYRWLAFWLHISSVLLLLVCYASKSVSRLKIKKLFSEAEINSILIIIIVSVSVNFLLLPIYPFVSIADDLRDSGFDAMRIASGDIKNIFDYGNYNGYGLIIPIFSSFFYYIFGSSVLTYRFPAALLSTIDILLLYFLIRIIINKQAAFWGAIILVTLPLHLYFARTHVIMAFNFFWMPVILLLFYKLLKKHRLIDYIFLGAIIGFISGFHAAIRSVACLVLLIILFLDFREIIFRKLMPDEKIRIRLVKIILLLLFVFIGFGPRLLFTGPQNFFHTSRLPLENKIEADLPIKSDDINTIKGNYIKSLMGYFYEPVTFFYHDPKPILSPILAIFFVLGIGYSVFVLKNYFLNILIFIILAIPFLNSAITDWVNADHRLSPIFSIVAIFVAIGITFCLNLIKNKIWKYIFASFIIFYISWQAIIFYTNQPANLKYKFQDYVLTHVLRFLQNEKIYQASPLMNLQYMSSANPPGQICLLVSSANYKYFHGNVGIIEQKKYLLPSADIQFAPGDSINDNEIYIVRSSCSGKGNTRRSNQTYTLSCVLGNKFTCPLNYIGDIKFHY